MSAVLALASLIQRSPVWEKERKAGVRPNGEKGKGRSRTPVMTMFIRHIDSDVKQESKGCTYMCSASTHLYADKVTCWRKALWGKGEEGCRMRRSSGSPSILCLVRTPAPFPVILHFPCSTLDYVRIPLSYGGSFLWKGYGSSSGIISRLGTYSREPDKQPAVAGHLGTWYCADLPRLVCHAEAKASISVRYRISRRG